MANKILEKYVPYDVPKSDEVYITWNMMNFYDCKVLNIQVVEYEKAGKRMTIEIEAPGLKKKYFLYAWSDRHIFEAIEASGLKKGDYISCHAELTYYRGKDGRHCEAYKIMSDDSFEPFMTESPRHFKLMRIRREADEKEQTVSRHLSKNEIIKMMLA